MEERRFDDLTRALGKATSRRQIFKGVLLGVAGLIGSQIHGATRKAEAASTGCNVDDCLDRARIWFATDCIRGTCGNAFRPSQFGFCFFSCRSAYSQRARACRESHGCDLGFHCSGGTCCGRGLTGCDGACTDTTSDRDNCGACGNACAPEAQCVDGQCQCTNQCPNGFLPDPTTCECNSCLGNTDGESCGTNMICCGEQCVSDQCQGAQVFNIASCSCECPSGGSICGDFCCSPEKDCCPDVLAGLACRDSDPECPPCQSSCGELCCPNDQFCCRAADYSYHCVGSSGDSC